MTELKQLVEISKYAGARWDWVQAGGGNVSVKTADGKMYIKASGVCLADVSLTGGYAVLDHVKLLKAFGQIMRRPGKTKELTEQKAALAMKACQISATPSASIETWLHAILKKYTLHIHPVVINALVCRRDWKKVLRHLFADIPYVAVAYKTPGIELALELKEMLSKKSATVIFLQNHGLVVSSDQKEQVISLTEQVLARAEKFLGLDMSAYKLTNELSSVYNDVVGTDYIAYLCQDNALLQQAVKLAGIDSVLFPDQVVYCGEKIVVIKKRLRETLGALCKRGAILPRVIIYKKRLFLMAPSLRKAREMEEVLRAHVQVLQTLKSGQAHALPRQELAYLTQWKAEKYRQKI